MNIIKPPFLFTIPSKHFPSHVSAIFATNPNSPTKEKLLMKMEEYNDKFFAKMAINYLSKSLQTTTGLSSDKTGYDSLVEAATMVAINFEPKQQHQLVLQALERVFPKTMLSLMRILLPKTKFTREFFAVFTTMFFTWLIGPSEVREREINGGRERSVVYVKKCRFLEQSNCVGMCTHLCKIPSQIFIKNSLGMPLYMMPNFDDMSCEMMFGQDPPELADDPAMKQPCFSFCKSNRKYSMKHGN